MLFSVRDNLTWIICLSTTFIFIASLANAKQGEMTPFRMSVHFGTRYLTEQVRTKVVISNTTSLIVKILEIRTSCSCIKAVPNSWIIPAKQSIEIPVLIDYYGGTEGEFEKEVLILTDDSSRPTILVTVDGKFISREHNLVTLPRYFDVGEAFPGQTIIQPIHVERLGTVRVGALEVKSSNEGIVTEYDPKASIESDLVYYVKVTAPKVFGPFQDRLQFIGGKSDFFNMVVTGIVLPPVHVMPEDILVEDRDRRNYSIVVNRTKSVGQFSGFKIIGSGVVHVDHCEERGYIPGDSSSLFLTLHVTGKGYFAEKMLLYFQGLQDPIGLGIAGYTN